MHVHPAAIILALVCSAELREKGKSVFYYPITILYTCLCWEGIQGLDSGFLGRGGGGGGGAQGP